MLTGSTTFPTVEIDVDLARQREIEQFLYLEAQLLDDRRFDDWYLLLADDLAYRAPHRYNRSAREIGSEIGGPDELAIFDDDKRSMGRRVRRLRTGTAWAEEPHSRTRRLVTNVRARPHGDVEAPAEFDVTSHLLLYRTRGTEDVDIWAARRDDVLRHIGEHRWQIARRTVLLDQSVVLSRSVSVFF